jgi:ADP-ribosylglycohydrolase
VGGGKTTLTAAQKLAAGTPWTDAGSDRPTNGAAMRAAPAGLFYARRPILAAEAARTQAHVTHTHPQAVAAAHAVAVGVATLVDTPFDPIHWLEGVARACPDPWPHLCERLADGYRRPLPDLFAHMNALLPSPLPEKVGLSTYAPHAVFWAMASFLRHPDDVLPALADALMAGGDTDTAAALAGALVGTRVGPEGLPKTFVDDLTDNGDWGAEKLAGLMADLATAGDRAA